MRVLDKLFNSIPTSILNAIAIISGTITIITAIPFLRILLIAIIKGSLSFTVIISNIRILPIVLGVLCTYFFFQAVKNKKIQNKIQFAYSDSYYSLLSGCKDVFLDTDNINLKNEIEYNNLRFFVSSVLDNLCSLLKVLTNKEISACVKVIKYDDILTIDNAKVLTFCRSRTSDPARLEHDLRNMAGDFIKDNTIYNFLVRPELTPTFFYECDLPAYAKRLRRVGKEYINSNPRWADYYKGVIVAPIRILNTKSPNEKDGKYSYTLLGFLCVDSTSKNAFLPSKTKYYSSIVKAYADAFAVILWKIQKKYYQTKE